MSEIVTHATPHVDALPDVALKDVALEKVALESYVAPSKPSLIGLSRDELADRLAGIGVAPGQRKMRVQQLWHWMYVRGAQEFSEMTNVSKDMREQLAEHFTLARPEVVTEQVSSDGTRKWLLRLPSGDAAERPHEVECVYIPETDRGTLCVSSQVGCTLSCTFCHTGTQRLVRNLTAGEIVGQVMVARDRLNDWPSSLSPPLRGRVGGGGVQVTPMFRAFPPPPTPPHEGEGRKKKAIALSPTLC